MNNKTDNANMTWTGARHWYAALLLYFGLMGLPAVANAAGQITSLSWEGDDKTEVLIKTSGKLDYQKQILQGGQRLRLVFRDTTIGGNVIDIPARDFVKGVYPYLAGDGTSTHVDFLVTTPGKLEVDKVRGGYKVSISKSGRKVSGATGANVIQEIRHARMPGNRMQVVIRMSQTPVEPQSFSISNPARISLDFSGTGVDMRKKTVTVNQGAVTSVSVVEVAGKARVVLNLVKPVAYKTAIEENAYVVTLESPTTALVKDKDSEVTRFTGSKTPGFHQIRNVDFRRDKDGGGKVVITLSDPSIGIDIREQGGDIIVDFANTRTPSNLVRRLDVLDFATPVQTIDTIVRGKNTRMIIRPHGRYEHLAYQAGNVFTVSVKPLSEEQIAEKRKDEFGYTGEKLSLNFQKIPVRDALQVLADFTGLNFVISDRVTGNLTLRLKDVPWDQAMDIILDSKNLGMRKKGNVVLIAPAKEIAAREKAELEATKTVLELEPLVSELIEINYAKASEIAALLKSIKAVAGSVPQSTTPFSSTSISGKVETDSNTLLSPRGQVTVDTRTNSLLVQDTPSKIREVRKLIAQLDKPIRQVMIEARLVEAQDTFGKALGTRFGVMQGARTASVDNWLTGNLDNAQDYYNGSTINYIPEGLNVNLPTFGVGGESPGQIALTVFNLAQFGLLQLELSALEQEGNGKIISSPRVITANQQKATIEQGQEFVFATGFGQSKTVTASLKLDVTPQITPDDRVILDVEIKKDSFIGSSDRINKKQVKTNVLLDNGETVSIGGIFETEEGNTTTGIPLFSKLPIVGWMFRKKETSTKKTELLIFLTPRILSESLQVK